jgi:hypothetical protein
MNHSYPDGTKRFAQLKIERKLRQAAAEAKASKDFTQEKEIKRELKKATKSTT